jgi:hypothetical protein
MKKRAKFLMVAICAMVIVATITFLRIHFTYRNILVKVVSSANKMEIQTTALYYDYPGKCLLEIEGQNKVLEFIKILDINEHGFNEPCKCDGDFQIAFFRDNEKLATIAIKHESGIEWFKGEWPGQTGLTKESRENIFGWLKEQGFVPDLEPHFSNGDY